MKKDEKIFVAGHRGLVGSAILEKLRKDGYGNIVTRTSGELDLRRQADVEAFFDDERPQYVFLAAATVGGILANSTYKAEFIYDNIMIAANVIEASYKYGAKKLLNLGSSCIYPKFAPQPMKEEDLLTGSLEPTNEPYAMAKIAAIKLCRYYNEQYGTNFISAMPTNLYGPNDNFDLETSHVLPAFIRKFHLAKLLCKELYDEIARDLADLDKPPVDKHEIDEYLLGEGITKDAVTVWGTGEPMREFLYVDDLADASIFLMSDFDYSDVGEIVNVGTGKEIKLKELAELVKDIVGFNGQIRYDTMKPDGTPRKLLDISKLKSMGWEPATSLQEGIKRTYESYVDSKRDIP